MYSKYKIRIIPARGQRRAETLLQQALVDAKMFVEKFSRIGGCRLHSINSFRISRSAAPEHPPDSILSFRFRRMPNDAWQPHNRYRCALRLSCSAAVFHGSVEGMNNDLRHPIGKFVRPATLTPQEREQALQKIAELPKKIRAAVTGLSESQIDTPYRDGTAQCFEPSTTSPTAP